MSRRLGSLAACGLALALAACGSKSVNPPILNPTEGGVAPPQTTGAGGTGAPMPPPDFDAGPQNGSVMIEIHSPAPPPAMEPMLSVNAAADVAAKITNTGSDLIDPASVRMQLTQGDSLTIISSAPLVGPSGDNEFKGKLSLAGLKSGEYTISISARSTTGATGVVSVKVNVDAGPLVTVLSPVPGAHYKTSLFVQLAADPGALGPLMGMPEASIGGEPVALAPAGPPNQFRAPFDLEKPLALTGDQLFTVAAVNKNGTRTEIRFVINVDIEGPEITSTLPAPGAIVGGVIKLSADIKDGAGLNDSSIQVLIGDKTAPVFRLALKNEIGTNTYSVLFDTKNLTACKLNTDPCIVRPTISFRAADLLGNETTVSYEIAIDNIPPISDLVPPPIYVWKYDMGMRCSHSFDPLDHDTVAGDAPDDLCVVPQMFDLRARIEDDGNHAAGLKQVPISKVDPENTAAYILDTTVLDGVPQPLVVDTDGDGFCDAVNPKLQPTTSPLQGPRQVLKVRLAPVPPAGAADFATPDPTLPLTLDGGGLCLAGRDTDPPVDLCRPGPQPSIAISYAGGLPAIWSAEPIAPKEPQYCFGSQLDTKANNIIAVKSVKPNLAPSAGWKCVAVVSCDLNGNCGTSQPIRVYLDDYAYGGAEPFKSGTFCNQSVATVAPNAGPPPNCTGTYDKVTMVVSQKACKSRNFKLPGNALELCERGDCGIPHWPDF
jgi:hypothetical protein